MTMPKLAKARADAKTIRDFLFRLFKSKLPEQHVYIWVKDKPRGGTTHSFANLEEAVKCAQDQAPQHDVYFGIALAPHRLKRSERVKSDEAAAIPGLWCEVDVGEAAHKGKNYPPTEQAALELIGEMPFKPTLIVHSGHGLHCYWLFKEGPWQLTKDEERELAKATEKKWLRFLQEKAHAHGWTIDSTYDLARVYRVAGTTNHKDKEDLKDVRLIEANAVYQRKELVDCVAGLPVSASRTKQKKASKAALGALPALKKLRFNPNGCYPAEKFDMLKEAEPKFKLTWERKRKDFIDQSASSYEQSIANYTVAAGWTEQEIWDTMAQWRRKHNEDLTKLARLDYFLEDTVKKARDLHSDRATQTAESERQAAVLQAVSGETLSLPEARSRLSQLLTVSVVKIQGQLGAVPTFTWHLGNGERVEVSTVAGMTDQRKLADTLFAYGKVVVPRIKKWDDAKRLILQCIEYVEPPEEATHLGECRDWLRCYLRDYIHVERVLEAQLQSLLQHHPAKLADGLWFSMKGFRHWLFMEGEHLPSKGVLIKRLTEIGCDYYESKSLHSDDVHTTRSLWRVPSELAALLEKEAKAATAE